jgi:RHS repeat-associated protein
MYNATGNVMHRYVFGPGIDEPIVWYEGPVTGAKTWLFADHLGSIVALDGSSTGIKTYGPYGEPLPASAASGDRFRYTGQQMASELGLYYYKARFYSPALGRFLQTDPVGYRSDLNLYAYVGNDPVNGIDPNGDIPLFFVLPGVGGAINAVLQGFGASQAGGSAYEIAAAAGKGFISGFAGTAAGLLTKNAATAGAISGGVENVINSGLNGKAPDPAGLVRDTLAGGGAGKIAAKIIPAQISPKDLFAPRGPSSGSPIPQISQNVATTLGQAASTALTKRK